MALEILISFALRVPSLIEFYYVGFSITGSQSELCLGLDFEASMIMNRYLKFAENKIRKKNMTEDFSPKALIVVERILELLG